MRGITGPHPTPYEEPEPTEPESLAQWIRRTGTTATAAPAATNPYIATAAPAATNPYMDDMPAGWRHWTVTLTNGAGRTLDVPFSQGPAHTEPPTARDVLSCLVMDIPEDGATFEDWAGDLGFDPDSRRAEHTFRAVERQTLALREWAGPDFESLRLVDADR